MKAIEITDANRIELSEEYDIMFGDNVISGDYLIVTPMDSGLLYHVIPADRVTEKVLELVDKANN